ncbi:MAG: glycosyltransferase family 4 protein, partial [Actinobacteria bacterium]|nr:glycosyltransferase family 4 protein [Actinomycetota bacterium]
LRSSVPVALMVQDLSFEHRPQDYPPVTRRRLQWAVRSQVHRARVVLTVSDHARSDLVRTYRLDPSRVLTIPNANLPAPAIGEDVLGAARTGLAAHGVDGPYFLYLGNLHPRKNVGSVIEAFGRARASDPRLDGHRLVIAGGRWWGSGEEDVARSAAPPGSVVFLGRVDDVQREVLLRDATALCYLSLFEGFGLPPLEAMARGTVVIASDRTSVPEVVGDAALVVGALDIAAIADAMVRVATDEGLATSLRERGLRRAAHYSVANTGRALHDAFTVALDRRWEQPLAQRCDGVLASIGVQAGTAATAFDIDCVDEAAALRRTSVACASLSAGDIGVLRVQRSGGGIGARLRPLSTDRLWRTAEADDCVVLAGWADPDRSEVLVVRRSFV